jgi:hypothetical protein
MTLNFDLTHVKTTEFGVGRDEDDARAFLTVPVDAKVQAALQEMVRATWEAMQGIQDGPSPYDPSEKYGSVEYLQLPLNDGLAAAVQQLHEAENLDMGSDALLDPSTVFSYFARLTDDSGNRLTAMRRATQFKGILKSKGRLVRLVDDTLRVVEDTVFKLDSDFDLLADSVSVHILRPSGFEFAGKLQQAILDAVGENVKAIRKDLAFVEFASIERYASKHPRASRYLASIRSQEETKNIDKAELKKLCGKTGVTVSEKNGKLTIAAGDEMGFLEVLDRRRYQLELVKGVPERFKAASRRKI